MVRFSSFYDKYRKNKMTIDTELDEIYDLIDDLFHVGEFERVNSILQDLDLKNTETDLLIGYLTATLPAKNKLPYRETFYRKVEKLLKERGDYEDGLLNGLES